MTDPFDSNLLAKTRLARHAIRAARLTEVVLLGVTTFTLVLAFSVLSTDAAVGLHGLIIASLCAAMASSAWWMQHRLNEAQTAARLEAQLAMEGAFQTAWEVEAGMVPDSAIARLLASRVSSRVPSARAVRAGLPKTAPWIAGPFLGAALLAFTLDRVREARDTSSTVVSARALANGISELRNSSPAEIPTAELEALRVDARELADLALDVDAEAVPQLVARVAEIEERLRELSTRANLDSESREALARARVLAGQTEMALEDLSESGEIAKNPAGEQGSDVRSGGAPGTMSGSLAGPESNETAPQVPGLAPGPAPDSSGAFSRGRWWPVRHETLVARWIEATREAD